MNAPGCPASFHSTYPLLLSSAPSIRSHRDVGAGSSEEGSRPAPNPLPVPESLSPQIEQLQNASSGDFLKVASETTFTALPSSRGSGDGGEVLSPRCEEAEASGASVLAYCKMLAKMAGSASLVFAVVAAIVALGQLLALGDVMGEDPSFVPSRPLIRGHFPEGPVRHAVGGSAATTTSATTASASDAAGASSPTPAAPSTAREKSSWTVVTEAGPHV
ncbi:hypothetical protein MTO96_029326 [Rhipicephalus appendiculatus]